MTEVGRQTWWGSIVEMKTNIVIGFSINYVCNLLILPMFGFTDLTLTKNFGIGLMFTGVSVARQLIIRRWFNKQKWGHKK